MHFVETHTNIQREPRLTAFVSQFVKRLQQFTSRGPVNTDELKPLIRPLNVSLIRGPIRATLSCHVVARFTALRVLRPTEGEEIKVWLIVVENTQRVNVEYD